MTPFAIELLSVLAQDRRHVIVLPMIPAELTQKMLKLPVEDRLELARQLMESVVSPATS